MKACVLRAAGDLRYEEMEPPPLLAGQVRLRVRAAGICASDIARVYGESNGSRYPAVPGHEFAGEIVEAAEPENRYLVGTRAAAYPLLPCFKCMACRMGQYAQCARGESYGAGLNGGLAEYVNVNVWNLVPVPAGVSSELAAMCEPAAVAVHALGVAAPRFGDTVVVSGAGVIGLMLAQLARGGGADKVVLMDVDEKKLAFARKLGFTHVVNTAGQDAGPVLDELTEGYGAYAVIEGSGHPASLRNCVRVAANYGHVVLLGSPGGDMGMDADTYSQIMRKQLSVKGTWNSAYGGDQNDWRTAMAAIAGGRLDLEPLMTHRMALSACREAFEMLRAQSEFALKVMLTVG